ncbi:TRAP transporter substrate-binding protein [Desulfofustis glycolicus]|uniref:Tripartite ATP-independent transporter solute receptor, DctP family n=1 Tax=Desulfofustis glycolicus DSM 9705 TaxID=1121409 RepID=A0A1M5RZS1_9BACT|nr:TRAP transporter substrate-binding protein [Desulfofustis glycolicus]MCB2216306.1 TRAP transporter substrate-binding protein [Desulfobulbaceae bacterium]SHH31548.1 tripartite ATP-independent transporter solute receptor, DctP family [Desulfofustis glycolicus DSM 9705]
MRRLMFCFAMFSVMAFCVVSAVQAKTLVRVGSIQSESFYMNKYMEKFFEIVNAKTNDAYDFKMFYSSVLGSEESMLEQLQMGTLDMQFGYSAIRPNYVKEFEAIGLPGVLASFDEVHTVMNGPIGQELADMFLEKTGVRILWFVDQAYRNIWLKDKEVNSLADLKGIKIRSPNSPLYIKILQTLGMNPTPLPFGEIYTAVQTGVVSGHEQEDPGVISMKFYEIENRGVVSHHVYQTAIWEISDIFYKKLPKEHQPIFYEAAEEAGIWFRPFTGEGAEKKAQQELIEKHGFKITALDQGELNALFTPMVDEYAKERGIYEFVQKIRKELGK